MTNYDEQADISFEQKTWQSARVGFSKNHDPKNYEPFLKDYTTPDVARKSVVQAQKEANSEYNGKLGGILEKVDMFMQVGDLAMKSAPESVGLAWTGIRMCLHAVQDDFATFAMFSGVCGDILGILISCRVYGKMYANKERPPEFVELHDKVLSYIGNTYSNIIEFSYQMWKHARSHSGVRIMKGLFRSSQGKFQPMIQSLRDNETQMNKYATQASQQVSEYYQRKGLDNDETMMRSFSEQREMLQAMQAASAKQNEMLFELIKHQNDLHKKELNKTASELAHEVLEQQLKEFGPLADNRGTLQAKIELRKKGTCGWILDDQDFQKFANSERGTIVWLVGNGGSGKSFLMATMIEELQKNNDADHGALVHYFFISKGSESTSQSERIKRDLLAQLYLAAADASLDILDKANKAIKSYFRDQKAASSSRGGKQSGSDVFDFGHTYKTLAKAIGKRILLVIDALDECVDKESEEFIQSFQALIKDEELQINIHFSGRDEPEVAMLLKDCSRINVEDHNAADVARDVQTEMEKLPGFTAAEREEASQVITRKAGSYFRYVELAINYMRRPWRRPLSKHLESLPPGVNNLYAQRLEQTDPDYYELLTTCLTWTILAGRELTVQELIDAYRGTYTFDETGAESGEDNEGADLRLYEEQIVKAGNEFLRISPEKTVTTVHNTVRDFFLRSNITDAKNAQSVKASTETECQCARCQAEQNRSKSFFVSAKEGHIQILITMLQHLLSPSFQKKYFPTEEQFKKLEFDSDDEDGDGDESGSSKHENDKGDPKTDDSVVNGVAAEPDKTKADENAPDPEDDNEEGDDGNDGDEGESEDEENDGEVREEGERVHNTDENGESGTRKPTDANINEDSTNGDVNGGKRESNANIQNGVGSSKDLNAQASSDTLKKSDAATGANGVANDNINSEDIEHNSDDQHGASGKVASDDGLSVADSDEKLDVKDEERQEASSGYVDEEFLVRYEAQKLLWHLIQLESLYPARDRSGEKWAQLRDLLDKFFVHGTKAWQGWLRTLWYGGDPLTQFTNDEDNPDEIHPIHVATGYNLTSVVQILMARPDASEAANLKLPYGANPLHLAMCWLGFKEEPVEGVVTSLLEAGADPNAELAIDNDPDSSPFCNFLSLKGVTVDLVKLFLKHGAKPNMLDNYGTNAIHAFASGRAEIDIGKALLDAGADVRSRSKTGETPLHWLVRRAQPRVDILKLFIEAGAEIDAEDDASERPLLECSKMGHVEAMKLLLDHGADIDDQNQLGETALLIAASSGRPKAVELLLGKGADPLLKTKSGGTAFDAACRQGDEESALLIGKVLLEKERSDLLEHQQAQSGKSSLMKAASKGFAKVIDFLLQNGDAQKELQKKSKKGRQALHFAAMKGRKAATEKLIAYGADRSSQDKFGHAPMQLCYSKIISKPSEEMEDTLMLLIEHDTEMALADIELLHTVVIHNSPRVVEKLVQLGVDPYTVDDHGWNAMQLAQQYERQEIITLLNGFQRKTTGIQPTRFVGKPPKGLVWSSDGLELENPETLEFFSTWVEDDQLYYEIRQSDQSFITDHPLPVSAERYYFEMTIDPLENTKDSTPIFAIGMCQKPTRPLKGWFPGWVRIGMSSWGFHSDDGNIYCCGDAPLTKDAGSAKKWGHGDTVGCGIDLKRHEIFWTLNGERLMKAGWMNVRGQLYPCIIISGRGKGRINLGTDLKNKEFLWKPGNTLDFDSDVPEPTPTLQRRKTGIDGN